MRMRKRIAAVVLAAVLIGQGSLPEVVGATCAETSSETTATMQGIASEGVCTVDISDGVLMHGGLLTGDTAVPSLGMGAQTDKEGAKTAIEAAWKDCKTSCNLEFYKIAVGDIKDLYTELLNEHPEYFYVAHSFSYSYSGGMVYSLTINYEYEASEIVIMKSKYDAEVELAVSGADTTWSDMEKVLYINEYLARNCEYDLTYSKYNAYNVLVDKTAVCQGYALAFKELAGQLGVECQIVTSESLNHAWNMVKVNDSYYMLDCTWNDPTPDFVGRVYHNYLLKSMSYFNSASGKHEAEDYQVSGSWDVTWASDATYDTCFWDNMRTGFDKIGDYWYAYDGVDSINRYTCDGNGFTYQKDILIALTDEWYVWGSTTQHYSGRTCIGSKNGRIYYSRPTGVYSLNVNSGGTATVYELSETEKELGYIYGLAVLADGSVVAELSTSPSENGILITIEKAVCADGHSYDEGIITQQPTCTQTGVKTYTCSVCGKTKTETIEAAGHEESVTVTPASIAQAGSIVTKCAVCEYVSSSVVIPAVADITLSDKIFVYTGVEQRPAVTVTDTAGNVLTAGTDYTLKHSGDGIQAGTYTVDVTLQGNYTGTKSLTYTILPEELSVLPPELPEQITVPNTVKTVKEAADKLPEGWYFCSESAEQSIPAGESITVTAEYIPEGETEGVATENIIITRDACVEDSAICYTGEGEAAPTCETAGVGHTECSLCGETMRTGIVVPSVGHVYDEGIITQQPTCTKTGVKTYTCSVCRKTKTTAIEAVGHEYSVTVTPASIARAGSVVVSCKKCTEESSTPIAAIKSIALSKTTYTYNGKVQRPSVTIKDSAGKSLKRGTDYTVTYSAGCKNVGSYTVTVAFKGNYTGTKKLTYTITPKGTTISKLTAAKRSFSVKWKKQTSQTTGYELQYSTNRNFTKKTTKTVRISKSGTISRAVTKLTAKKKYYVRIRTYKTVKISGKSTRLYSAWSKAKTVTTKR